DASEGGPNGPERNAEGHRDRLDPVPRPSETSLPRGKVLLAGPKQQEMIVVPRSARARGGSENQRPWPADKVERWAIDRLIPYAKNARTHTDAQVAAIAASIKEWGWTTPAL